MISFEDCAALCGLDEDQIDAIAEHEHVPAIEATAIASDLLSHPGGAKAIQGMFVDLIRATVHEHRLAHASELLRALRHFLNREALGEVA